MSVTKGAVTGELAARLMLLHYHGDLYGTFEAKAPCTARFPVMSGVNMFLLRNGQTAFVPRQAA